MNGYIGVGGTARKIKGLYVGVNGVARTVQKAYVGDASGKARLWYQRGKPLSNYAVGSSVYFKVNNVRTQWLVVQQGNPNASIYDSSCDGTWLLMKDIYMTGQFHTVNDTTYSKSWVHSYLNGTFLRQIEETVRNLVKEAVIPWKGNYKNYTGANGLSAKVFLLGSQELGYKHNYLSTKCGSVLSYFSSCDTRDADPKRVAYLDGNAAEWWSRSPSSGTYEYYTDQNGSGYVSGTDLLYSYPRNSKGIRPCLILPRSATVDDSSNVIGG